MSVSTRLSIHWPETEPEVPPEKTDTLVLTTPTGEYVDIRVLKDAPAGSWPCEWAFCGCEKVIEEGSPMKIQFTHDFWDSEYIKAYAKWQLGAGEKPDRSKISVDIGNFQTISNGTRNETGEMPNPATGNVEPYLENWLSLDPLSAEKTQLDESKPQPAYTVLQYDIVDTAQYEGRFVRMGVWAQGLLWDKSNSSDPMSVVRRSFDGSKWNTLVEYGPLASKMDGLEEAAKDTGLFKLVQSA